ncbi:MAG TPA: hypothetical protein VMW52_12920 [Phycisphaerae bacterium]|nr:hypothetical protein [Phycisphaerae bacterium]
MTADQERRAEERNLTLARRRLNGTLAPDLDIVERARRVEAYAQQVQQAGRITAWLPPAPRDCLRPRYVPAAWKRGRQYRWLQIGRLEGSTWSPAFVAAG